MTRTLTITYDKSNKDTPTHERGKQMNIGDRVKFRTIGGWYNRGIIRDMDKDSYLIEVDELGYDPPEDEYIPLPYYIRVLACEEIIEQETCKDVEVKRIDKIDKFDRQLLNDEIDMLKGNINRMCVSDDADELRQMENYALIRLTNIAKMCDLRMKELMEKQMTQSNCCGDCGKCERSQLSTCLFPDRLESFIRHKKGER